MMELNQEGIESAFLMIGCSILQLVKANIRSMEIVKFMSLVHISDLGILARRQKKKKNQPFLQAKWLQAKQEKQERPHQ